MDIKLHSSWKSLLYNEFEQPYFLKLRDFIRQEYLTTKIFPPPSLLFSAFNSCPVDQVKVVILGQDPYHTIGAAMGLAFSIPNGSKSQPSLVNIFKELSDDLGVTRTNTDLSDWADQGVFLLNSVLTVRSNQAASHQNMGWEIFTDKVIELLANNKDHLVFILWGKFAETKAKLIDPTKHLIIRSPHPSPFSAHKGFFGSKPFSQANNYLQANGKGEINW